MDDDVRKSNTSEEKLDVDSDVRDNPEAEWTGTLTKNPGLPTDSKLSTNTSPGTGQNYQSNEGNQGFLNISSSSSPSTALEVEMVKSGLGWENQVKELYASTASVCSCCVTWEDEKPFREFDDDTDKKNRELAKFALVRKQIPHGGHGAWKTSEIEVHSPLLRKKLTDVFRDYPAVDAHAVKMSFKPPFLPFIHRWDRLQQMLEEEEAGNTKDHLRLLETLLTSEIQESLELLQHIKSTGYVSFGNLPLVFVPGDVIIENNQGIKNAGILRKAYLGGDKFAIVVRVVDWNGKHFGAIDETLTLRPFQGSLQLTKMSLSPLRIHTDRKMIRDQLVARGKEFENLRGQHHRFYSGKVWCEPAKFDRGSYGRHQRLKPIRERVIIDAKAYYTLQDDCIPDLLPLSSLEYRSDTDKEGHVRDETTSDDESLTNDQRMLACSTVIGFGLQSKMWCHFEISYLADILWTKNPLQYLVLESEEKSMLLSVLRIPRNQYEFDDFIPGKGKGVIILLCGSPGVGKTMTAESLAEQLQRPLYKLEARDLGTAVNTVESALKDTLRRCTQWNTVLLIDEADVFLECRSADSQQRNELVSIFLRLLEYYQGVMILTTNRTSALDPAFESRIDIIVECPDLTLDSRSQIWRNYLGTVKQNTTPIGDEDIDELAKYPLNGRQIKSAVKIALIMAAGEGEGLNMDDLRVVLHSRLKAGKLLKGTRASPKV